MSQATDTAIATAPDAPPAEAAPPPAKPSMFVPEMAPTPPPAEEPAPAELTAEAAEQPAETPEPATEPAKEPGKPAFDKGVQRIQQARAEDRREFDSFKTQVNETLAEIRDSLKGLAIKTDAPAPKQSKTESTSAVAKAADEIRESIAALKSEAYVDGDTLVKPLEAMLARLDALADKVEKNPATNKGTIQAEVQAAIKAEAEASRQAQQAQHEANQQFNTAFDAQFKDFAGRGADMLKIANEAFAAKHGATLASASPEARQTAFNVFWQSFMEHQHVASTPVAAPKPTYPVKPTPPPHRTPSQATSGAISVPPGANTGRPAAPPAKPKPAMWRPDDV